MTNGLMIFKDENYGETISYLGHYEHDQELNKIVSHALDGSTYIQTVGEPSGKIAATIIYDAENETLLKRAEANTSLVSLKTRDKTIYGRIINMELSHKWANGKYSANLIIAEEK